MGTTAQTFYQVDTDWDGTDPSGGNVRKVQETLPSPNSATVCQFGTSGNKNIICDPHTANATDGITDLDKFGWAINLDTADGMQAITGVEHRRILSGTWQAIGQCRANVAALSAVTLHGRIYKFNANGSRTQLASGSAGLGLLTTAGSSYTINFTGVAEVEIEDDETVMASFYVNATGQIGGLNVIFDVGDNLLADTRIVVPAPGVRTIYFLEQAGTLNGIGSDQRETHKELVGVYAGVATVARSAVLARTLAVVLAGNASLDRLLVLQRTFAATLTGIGTLIRQLSLFRAFSAIAIGIGTQDKIVRKLLRATMSGVATMSRLAQIFRAFSAVMSGGGTVQKRIGKPLSATLSGFAAAFLYIPFDLVPGDGSDGTTVIVVED